MKIKDELSNLVRSTFMLPDSYDLHDAALGVTQNWTSLMHIKLILLVEKHFKIKMSSHLIINTHSFTSLLQALENILVDDSQNY